MNEPTMLIVAFVIGVVLGWIAFGMTVMTDCSKIGAITIGGNAFICEVKK